MITKGRNPKYQGSWELRHQCPELEQSWEEAAASPTPLSLNQVTSNRLSVEPPLGLTAISHSSGTPPLNKDRASALPSVSVFQCQIFTIFIRHLNSTFSVTNSPYDGCKHVSRGPHAARQFTLHDQLLTLVQLSKAAAGSSSKNFWIAQIFISSQAWSFKNACCRWMVTHNIRHQRKLTIYCKSNHYKDT